MNQDCRYEFLPVSALDFGEKKMRRILVPCDFSGPAVEAFKFACDLAVRSNGEVIVLKVIDLPVLYESTFGMPPYVFNPVLEKELEEDATRNFEKMKEKFGQKPVSLMFKAVHGPTTPMIRDFMDENKVDLVVMGTHGATGLKEFFVGSNTEKIVRFSPVPVFSIRETISPESMKNIVFPTTLAIHQRDFLDRLIKLQEFFKATLHVLYVNTPSNFINEKELADYAKQCRLSNFTLNLRNNRHEQDGIIDFVHEKKYDMIAMATHARKGLAHFLTGSIAEDVVNRVTCPIWTYALAREAAKGL